MVVRSFRIFALLNPYQCPATEYSVRESTLEGWTMHSNTAITTNPLLVMLVSPT